MPEENLDKELTAEKEAENDTDSRIYEVGYLIVPTIAGEDVPAIYGNLKELVINTGGEIISDEMPKMINLAYSMLKVVSNIRSKFNTAYFGWVKFEMSPDKISELKKKLDLDPNIIRFLITKTVRENTIAAKRFIHRDMAHRKPVMAKKGENEAVAPIDKEEIDKEIEAMIAV